MAKKAEKAVTKKATTTNKKAEDNKMKKAATKKAVTKKATTEKATKATTTKKATKATTTKKATKATTTKKATKATKPQGPPMHTDKTGVNCIVYPQTETYNNRTARRCRVSDLGPGIQVRMAGGLVRATVIDREELGKGLFIVKCEETGEGYEAGKVYVVSHRHLRLGWATGRRQDKIEKAPKDESKAPKEVKAPKATPKAKKAPKATKAAAKGKGKGKAKKAA